MGSSMGYKWGHKWGHKWGRKWGHARSDHGEGKTTHRPEPPIDQAEARHDAASIGFIAVNFQQGYNHGKESGLESAGDKQTP